MKKNLLLAAFCGGMVVLTGCAPTVAEIVEMHNKDLVAGKFDTSMPHTESVRETQLHLINLLPRLMSFLQNTVLTLL